MIVQERREQHNEPPGRRRGRSTVRLVGSLLALLLLLVACVQITPVGDKIIVSVVGIYGKPIQGVEIVIGGETEITDENGHACFQITGTDYELFALELFLNLALYLPGLETAAGDIKLVLPFNTGTTASMADVSGDLTGAVDNDDPLVTTYVGGRTENVQSNGTVGGTGTNLTYDLNLMFQNTLANADLFALQTEINPDGSYKQGRTVGFANAVIGDGNTAIQDIALAPVTNQAHNVNVGLPAGFNNRFWALGTAIQNISDPDLTFNPWYVDIEEQVGDFATPVGIPATVNYFDWGLGVDFDVRLAARLAAVDANGAEVRGSHIGDLGMDVNIDLSGVVPPTFTPNSGTFDLTTNFDAVGSGSFLWTTFTPQDVDATTLIVGTSVPDKTLRGQS